MIARSYIYFVTYLQKKGGSSWDCLFVRILQDECNPCLSFATYHTHTHIYSHRQVSSQPLCCIYMGCREQRDGWSALCVPEACHCINTCAQMYRDPFDYLTSPPLTQTLISHLSCLYQRKRHKYFLNMWKCVYVFIFSLEDLED